MSVIHVGHIKNEILGRFGSLVDLTDVSAAPAEQREATQLTRSLAAFVLAELGGLDDVGAAQGVTDGTGDNGIDAVYFDPAEKNCFLVQTKWISSGNGSIEVGDIHKFIQGVRDLLNNDLSKFNAKMQTHAQKVFAALSDSAPRFTLVLAYTGEQPLSEAAERPLTDFLSEMNSPTEVMALRILNQAALHTIVASGATADAVDLEIMLHDWGMVEEPYLAYYGHVAVSDIATWGTYGSRLTTKNLRQFRGLTDVNESIANTLGTSPENFWYFNNGITILCQSLRKKPLGGSNNDTGTFECEGANVVNGAQTVGTIVDVSRSKSQVIQSARVLVRLVSLENCPPGFAEEITRAANTQNRIAGCTLDEASVALACEAADIALCVQAKREVGMLYEDITKPPYTIIFNRGTTARVLWRAVTILRLVESALKAEQRTRAGKEQLIAIHGNRFVLHLVFQKLALRPPENGEAELDAVEVNSLTYEMLKSTIENVLAHYQSAYPANLFKNASRCRDLSKRILQPPVFAHQ